MGRAGVAAFALALVFAGGAGAADYEWRIVRVVDGDTIRVDAAPDLPPELARLSVRVRGVDTPEKGGRAKCADERRGGLAATAFTGRAIRAGRRVVIRNPEWGKWGGRVIADVLIDGRGLALAQVKGGAFHAGRFRDFQRVMERDRAAVGYFVTLDPVTSSQACQEAAMMRDVRIQASRYPRMQLWSISDDFEDRMPRIPPMTDPCTGKPLMRQARLS